MANSGPLGQKLRRLRRDRGLTQVGLAAQLDISPSYLNLIEHNQRAVTLPLMAKLSACLDVELEGLSGSAEARLLAELGEVFGDPLFRDRAIGRDALGELVGAAPEVCQAVLALYRAYLNGQAEVQGLGARLTADPYLTESNHQLLTLLTSVRSFAEILRDNRGLEESKRLEFTEVLVAESGKLTDLVNQLFAFIGGDNLATPASSEVAAEEVSGRIQAQNNHFPAIEAVAATLPFFGAATADERAAALIDHLTGKLGVKVAVVSSLGDGASDESGFTPRGRPLPWRYESSPARLLLHESLPESGRRFQLARLLGWLTFRDLFDGQADGAELSSPEARRLYRHSLTNSFAAALLFPYDGFLQAARELQYDLDRLCQRFGGSFEQICQRLSSLQRPGTEGVPFHFLRADIAGNIIKRFSASGLHLPRFGGVCPRWNLHGALLTPGRLDRQLVSLPDGGSYLFLARTVSSPAPAYGVPQGYGVVGLGCDVSFASQLIYAEGLDLSGGKGTVPVGINCRHCPRGDCAQRAFPSPLA